MPNQQNKAPLKFILTFLVLFMAFYFFNLAFFSVTSTNSDYYMPLLANHLNYIEWLRWFLLQGTRLLLSLFGFVAICNKYYLLVAGRGEIQLVYTCLGLGVMSFFTAFVLAYPKPLKARVAFLISGLVGIQLLNIVRFALLALYWNRSAARIVDHHTIFNILIYVIILTGLYFWIKTDTRSINAAN